MHKHSAFILSSITDILEDVVTASSGIGMGIETYPLCDYIMQSVFLKMTGFQEQKMKCICWEMATNDYDYRREFTNHPPGECSSYSEKQKIYGELVKQLEKHGTKFSINIIENKNEMPAKILDNITNIFVGMNLSVWAQNDFLKFKELLKHVAGKHFANEKGTLFSDKVLIDIYVDHLYRQRNRIAHNTQSYQQNLPTLKTLAADEYKYENYFIYFFVLVLIDEIFISLYQKYLVAVKESVH